MSHRPPCRFALLNELVFDDAGNIYVTDSFQATIFRVPPGGSPDPMPWANPANIAFDDHARALLVTNHASLVMPPDPSLFSVFDVFVDDKGQPVP